MDPIRKIVAPKTVGPVDLQLILNPTVTVKTKLQLVQNICESLEECCWHQNYFDNMIFVLIKLLSNTDPVFSPENDVFKLRKLILQVLYRVCSSCDKIQNHVQTTMEACIKVIETDNEQCAIYSVLIVKELLTLVRPTFVGCYKTEICKLLKLTMNMYINSSTQEKIFNCQKTNDLKVMITTIRSTTTITKNSINYIFIPMGKVSFKCLKELANLLKLYYILFCDDQTFRHEIVQLFPILINFFNLDLPYKPDIRELILDLRHAQIRLLFFFALFLKDNKEAATRLHCASLPARIISFLSCNTSTDNNSLRSELLSGFESVILTDYKCEFLPFMDKFLDVTLITGKSFPLKSILRPKAYILIDHIITHLHSKLSLNYLVRVIHLHLSNILDSTLQPEVQINLCNMVMNILSYIFHRQYQSITIINMNEKNSPFVDLFYRVFQVFVKKLKQFQTFYLPQLLDENNVAKENIDNNNISSILEEYSSKVTQNEFTYGYHSSQVLPYTLEDGIRFIQLIIPAIRTLFKFIANINRGKFSVGYCYERSFNSFLKYALLSLNVYNCSIKKREMVKEILTTLSCVKPVRLKTLIVKSNLIAQIYNNNLQIFVFDRALKDETLASTFSCLIFEFITNNISNENEKLCLFDLIDRLHMHFKLHSNEEIVNQYISRVIKMLTIHLKHSKYPAIYLEILRKIFIILESAKYEFDDNINSVLRCLLSDLLVYHKSLPDNLTVTKNAIAKLCLAECLFKVLVHSQIVDLLSLIVYSIQFTEVTLQGLVILEKIIGTIPVSLFDDPILEIQNEIVNGLCFCVNSPVKSISQSAVKLLGRLGGFNRSSTIKPCHFSVNERNCQVSENPKIFVSFEDYSNQFIGIDVVPGLSSAVEKLISSHDRFLRAHSWNIIKGFLLVAIDGDTTEFTLVPANINWHKFVDLFSNNELQYVRTKTDETYIKALTGLMICCADDHLNNDSQKYLTEFTKVIVCVSLRHFCGISSKSTLKVNPYVLIDAITKVLSNEREKISEIGKTATLLLLEELHNILKDNMLYFPLMEYMFRQFCELCYNSSWICKRAGCFGLHILFVNLFTEGTMKKQFSNWFMERFVTAFQAMMFIFSDFNKHLTFGAMEIASDNLECMFNWLFWFKPTWSSTSFNLIETTVLKNLLDNIIGPNDLLREQSIKIIDLMAVKQKSTVSDILKPYFKYLKKVIPGNRFFNTYTFNSQLGIMKAHIFFALNCFPAKRLDFSKRKHTYYFNFLCNLCKKNNERTKKNTSKDFPRQQVHKFHLTAIQVLANCQQFLTRSNKLKVFKILLNTLKRPNEELQEMAYRCLQSCNSNLTARQVAMVDKLLSSSESLLQNYAKVTQRNIRFTLYLSKLYPSRLNLKFCSILVNLFKHFWDNLLHCKTETARDNLQLSLMNILETFCMITEVQFIHIQSLSEIILNADISNVINWCDKLYPLLTECILKFPNEFLRFFFQEKHLKNSVWCSFFNSIICNEKYEHFRNLLISDHSRFEHLLLISRVDDSNKCEYEIIKIIYNLVKMNTIWITKKKKLVSVLLNIWSAPQYKERYKNLANVKSTEWDEPKMLLKIVLVYFKENKLEVYTLFQILPGLTFKFPFDTNFFRLFLENEVAKSYTVQWKQMVFIRFTELYQKKGVNNDIIGKVLQYIILPCFSICYKNGEKDQLLCRLANFNDNIIGIILNKILTNIRGALSGCDLDGIKASLCQLICLFIEELLLFDESICNTIYSSVISCMSAKCTMDVNVKYHCHLILILILSSGKVSGKEQLSREIYYALLKANSTEAQPVINHSLNLLVSSVCKNEDELSNVGGMAACLKRIMNAESQNIPTLHHICSFLVKNHTLFFPYRQFLIRGIMVSLFPISKSNMVAEFKKTAIELSCMVINWELNDDEENMKLKLPLKCTTYEASSTIPNTNKSSYTIDNCLNFLAMVGCQTNEENSESRISKLAVRSVTLFKNILSTEPIDAKEVKLKFNWIGVIIDNFLRKESMVKLNPSALGNTNASLMNLLSTFDIVSFMLNVLSQEMVLAGLKPLQEQLMKFLQLAYDEEDTLNDLYNYSCQKDNSTVNRLSDKQIKQCNEGTIKFISSILKTVPTKDGLEKLHLFIQMIISEGLNSNLSYRLEISLTLLKASLKHFPNYINIDVLNTLGDIMFKFNQNNSNPLLKIKCLEILKTHVDTLSRFRKQLFFEKVIIENLNKALDLENKIHFDVQIKCFQFIITYIQHLPEATERILLNTTLMQYITTTTDEQIMIAILNLLTKWIEVCRDETVYFNNKIIDILKYITALNRFPKFSDYCYKLNLEIYKNWKFDECIEFGLNCQTPAIRFEFVNFHNSLWRGDSGLCSRLFNILSNELSYDLEFSLAFSLQILMVNISKNTKIRGDFSLFGTEQLIRNDETLAATKNVSSSALLSYDMCSSLVQLCFVDENVARALWISILPNILDLFDDITKKSLSAKSVDFLTNGKLKSNFMIAFFEALCLCKPKINFEPHQLVYIGKTNHLWYETIDQLEDICNDYTHNHFEHNRKDEIVNGLIEMYSFLREEDILEGLFQIMLSCDYTKKALSFEQQGDFKQASQMYIELLDYDENQTKVNVNNFYNKEKEFKKIHLTKCLKELNQWDILSKHVLTENDCMLNIELAWKEPIESSISHDLKWYLKHKQKSWPSKLNWKYHFYLGMLDLNTLDEEIMSTVQKHIEHSFDEITNNWKCLPKYLCSAHIPLLQASQLIIEMQEVCDVQNRWLQTQNSTDFIDLIINIWNKRKPWVADDLSVSNDFVSLRQTYYLNLVSPVLHAKSALDQSKLGFAEIALKQNMIDVCMNTLKSIIPDGNTSNLMYKMYLEAKCVQKNKNHLAKFTSLTLSLLNKDLTNPLLLLLRGSFQDYSGNSDVAFKLFTMAFSNQNSTDPNNTEWQYVIENHFSSLSHNIYKCNVDNQKLTLDNHLTTLNSNEILKNGWIQWAKLIQNKFNQPSVENINIALAAMKCYVIASKLTSNIKCNIIVAKILWILTYDDDNCSLLRAFEKCNITFSDLWIPQILNIIVEKNKSTIQKIALKIGKLCPQKVYLTLNRMYLTEKMNFIKESLTSVDIEESNIEKFLTTKNTKMDKIKQIMKSLQKCKLGMVYTLDQFVNKMVAFGESRDENIRRNLYECLYLCYDCAFEKKNINISTPSQITDFIKNIYVLFVEHLDSDDLEMKKPFSTFNTLAQYYKFMMEKYVIDFNFDEVNTINLVIQQLKKWISYFEKKSNYSSRFCPKLNGFSINNFDWSMIKLPSENFTDDTFSAVRIHNFSSHVYVKDKVGTIVKQITIRGTNGLLYTYNISRGQDIESEERILQLFHIANNYLFNFKETAKRFLKIFIPRTFIIAPHVCMVESNNSVISLFDVYKDNNVTKWEDIHEDIEYWYSVLNTSVIIERTEPLKQSFFSTSKQFNSGDVMKNWALTKYPVTSDYWTFRKIFIEHYSVLCFFEYAFNLIKVKPEMLNIYQNNGVVVVLLYKFLSNKDQGKLVQNHSVPFRLTPSLLNFITPYRKYQIINCLNAIGQCFNNSIEDITSVVRLLLKDEFKTGYNTFKNDETMLRSNYHIIEIVNKNLDCISKNLENMKMVSMENPAHDLVYQAFHDDNLCHMSPTWRPWL